MRYFLIGTLFVCSSAIAGECGEFANVYEHATYIEISQVQLSEEEKSFLAKAEAFENLVLEGLNSDSKFKAMAKSSESFRMGYLISISRFCQENPEATIDVANAAELPKWQAFK
jgi:hypothetical protein